MGTGAFDARDASHIWLRQAVTLSENGQTRTLEVAVPVRLGATPEEIEAMLAEADAGMARLTRHLDGQVARAFQSTLATLQGAEPHQEHALAEVATPSREAIAPLPAVPAPTPVSESPTPAPAMPQATTPPTSVPSRGRASGPLTSPAVPAPARTSPATTAKPTVPARPAAPTTPTAPAAASRPTTPAAAHAPQDGGGELTRPQFIAATAALGLNPKQAMDRLGVRTLEGLNLREALETLRRQEMRGSQGSTTPDTSDTTMPPPSTPSTPSASAPARKAPTSAAPASRAPTPPAPSRASADTYTFEEEDDLPPLEALDEDALGPFAPLGEDEDEDDGAQAYDLPGYHPAAAPAEPDLPDALDLDDLEDLEGAETVGPLGAPEGFDEEDEDLAPLPPLPPSLPRGRIAEQAPAPTPEPPGRASTSGSLGMSAEVRSRVITRIGKLRAAQGGGAATPYQLNAYKNLVISALGEPTATQLVRGLWGLPVAQLGSEQIAELVDWAKKDEDFEEEAQRVLAALRAERERAARESAEAPRRTPSSGSAPRRPAPGGRPAPRSGGGV